MWDFGDGREERLGALALELRLRRSPELRRRNEEYKTAVRRARDHARTLTQAQIIERLTEHNPAYLRNLLETEDERFGKGSLAGRYARTFYREFKLTCEDRSHADAAHH